MHIYGKKDRKSRGTAALELGIAGPLLILMVIGAIDFGRIFYQAVTIANAAETCAFYGTQNNVKSGHFSGMQQAARDYAQSIGTITATGDRFCACPDGNTVDCVTGTCAGYGPPRVYARCLVEKQFRLIAPIPEIPNPVTVRKRVVMRVQ